MPNPRNISTEIGLALTDHSVDLLRIAEHSNERVRAILAELRTDVANALTASGLSEANEERLRMLLIEVDGMISLSYRHLTGINVSTIQELISTEALVVAGIINEVIGVDLLSKVLPPEQILQLASNFLVQGAPSADWWAKQGEDLSFRFAKEVRMGLTAGETNPQIVSRVIGSLAEPGVFDVSRKSAEALVRTTVMTGANSARLAMYQRNSDVIAGVQQLSTLDSRTTEICMAYDHQSWDLNGKPIRGSSLPFNGGPPRHWNCRSTLVPILFSWRELGVDGDKIAPATRASMDGQVSAEIDYNTWLESRSRSQQNEILGKGKAELWRNKQITLVDLLDRRGDPLTLAQLRQKHGLQ